MNKKVYIRGYETAKKVCVDAKKVCIVAKKVYIAAKKVNIFETKVCKKFTLFIKK